MAGSAHHVGDDSNSANAIGTLRWKKDGVEAVRKAASRLAGIVHRTPIMKSRQLDSIFDCEVLLKAEMYQRTGSFKFRGAYNRLLQLPKASTGIVTHSSGNFAQAVALAGQLLGIAVTIVMPESAPTLKIEAARSYGAAIIFCGSDSAERMAAASDVARNRGLTLIEPYDDYDVIAGQGTATLELIEDCGELDALLVPLGGGGLLAGSATIAKGMSSSVRVIGVEPASMPKTSLSLAHGKRESVAFHSTVMDGQRIATPGSITFPIISEFVDDVITVDDRAAAFAMKWLYERLKVVAEPSGASAFAAILTGAVDPKGQVGVILSGGNIGIEQVSRICNDECV